MFVEAEDWRPPSLLGRRRVSNAQVAGGLITALLSHVLAPVAVMVGTAVLTALGFLQSLIPDEPVQEREIVSARFVKLGKPLDPRKLPDRKVPRLSTAPNNDKVYSKQAERRERIDAGVPPPNAVEDEMQRIGDRVQAFAEIAELREQEGSLEGIEEGTATEGKAGDIYAGKLYAFFRRGWTIPTIVSEEERQSLVTDIDVTIGSDLTVKDHRIRRSSGNLLFDQSVSDRLDQLKTEGATLPEPPEDVAEDFIGKTIGLRFRGRDAG